jgi:GTP-binding protein
VEPRPPFYLVDLPGFGYARGGDKAREEFDALAAAYFGARVNDPRFRGVFVLVDSRHPGLDSDRSTWNWLDSHGVVRHVVATKVDKLDAVRSGGVISGNSNGFTQDRSRQSRRKPVKDWMHCGRRSQV